MKDEEYGVRNERKEWRERNEKGLNGGNWSFSQILLLICNYIFC